MIGLLCPTRGRPKEFARLTASVLSTISEPCAMVAVLDVDKERDYDASVLDKWDLASIPAGCGSVAASEAGGQLLLRDPRVDVIVSINDDVVVRTPNWDKLLLAAIPSDGYGVAYPDDGWCHKCTFPVVTRKWIEAVGHFQPYGFTVWFPDTWYASVAIRLGRMRYVPEVLFEHLHVFTGKAPMDKTYAEGGAHPARVEHDKWWWEKTAHLRIEEVEKLRKAITCAEHNQQDSQKPSLAL